MSALRVSIAVQHHPSRADLLPALLAAIGDAEVVTDPEPDGRPHPWRTYREALDSTPDDATHRMILQDDITPCRNFPAALAAAVEARPGSVLALFHGGNPRENAPLLDRALAAGETWVRLNSRRWIPAVALVWPVRLVCPVVCWVEEQNYPGAFRADDEIIARALRALGEDVLACVPSIVQHEDVVPSVTGQRARGGVDRGRVAAHWIGDQDPLGLDWTAGAA